MTALLTGTRLPINRIPARREMYQRYCSLPAYPAILIGHFDPFQWAANPNRRSDFYDARQKEAVAAPAIITDVGAPLSHAAIVARELGIPAVVGCGNAMMLLKTGDHIRVDGGRGTVHLI